MAGRLDGKAVIITGSAQGIGAAYARRCAAEGANVTIVDLTRIDQAADVQADIEKLGRKSLAIKADVTDQEAMRDVAKQTYDEFGSIDVLVNNAGLMFDQLTATWEQFLAVNFFGAVYASNAVVPYMWERRSGSIINISSTAAFPLSLGGVLAYPADAPAPEIGVEGYGMTKWMLIKQTRSMAQLLGVRNIRVNAVCPGVTMSPAGKEVVPEFVTQAIVNDSILKTSLEPDDMAGIVLFLACDDGAKMTGQVLINDAGTWFGGA
jgi:NAD(P)-dependent dehydrogenase (short-subunit alcohol dehydrogenase family)